MVDKKIYRYFKVGRSRGFSITRLRNELLKNGFKEIDVDKALLRYLRERNFLNIKRYNKLTRYQYNKKRRSRSADSKRLKRLKKTWLSLIIISSLLFIAGVTALIVFVA